MASLQGLVSEFPVDIGLNKDFEMPTQTEVENPVSPLGVEANEWKFVPCSLSARYNKIPHMLRLSKQGIIFGPAGAKSGHSQWIRTDDIVGLKISATKTGSSQVYIHTAYYASKGGCSNPTARVKLTRTVYEFEAQSGAELDQFKLEMDNLFRDPNNKRPRKLVVIINPIGGHGKAKAEYERKARPIFQLAGVQLIELLTERKHHVYEIMEGLDITEVDAIVSVGGDGMFFEIINGIMKRPDHQRAIKIPVGLIPTGSQNALAVSCSGSAEVEHHALHIVKGHTMPMDAVKVRHNASGKVMYSSIVTAFGYIADVGNTAQNYRRLGPFRYLFCGAMHLSKPKFYKIKLNYIPHDSDDWKILEEEIFCFMACNLSCANTQFSALCPHALPTDGCMSLCLWKKCSRLNMVQFSSRQKKGTHIHLPFVQMLKVKALKFEPITEGGFVNIDGEIFEKSQLEFELQPSFITLMCSPHVPL